METNENRTGKYAFTIVVPVYNEEESISQLEEKLRSFLPHSLYKTAVLFVNDGSTDQSGSRIQKICERNNDFFYLTLQQNGGLSAALKAGFDYCFSEYVGYMDADMQTDAEDFNLLLPHLATHAFVTGITRRCCVNTSAINPPHQSKQVSAYFMSGSITTVRRKITIDEASADR